MNVRSAWNWTKPGLPDKTLWNVLHSGGASIPDENVLGALRSDCIPNPFFDPARPDWFTAKASY